MINHIQIKLPYPIRVGFFSINRKIDLWLSFDNLSLFLFQHNEDINDSKQFEQWQNKHGKFDLFVYGCYYAAKSYAMQHRLKFEIEFKKFATGLASLSETEIKELTEVWQRSNNYGKTSLPGKKKAVTNQSR